MKATQGKKRTLLVIVVILFVLACLSCLIGAYFMCRDGNCMATFSGKPVTTAPVSVSALGEPSPAENAAVPVVVAPPAEDPGKGENPNQEDQPDKCTKLNKKGHLTCGNPPGSGEHDNGKGKGNGNGNGNGNDNGKGKGNGNGNGNGNDKEDKPETPAFPAPAQPSHPQHPTHPSHPDHPQHP